MSEQHFDHDDTKKFTLTAILSFVTIFCFLMLMMNCHGDYKPRGEKPATEHTEK